MPWIVAPLPPPQKPLSATPCVRKLFLFYIEINRLFIFAALAHDLRKVPNYRPFIAVISNLPSDIESDDIFEFFRNEKVRIKCKNL